MMSKKRLTLLSAIVIISLTVLCIGGCGIFGSPGIKLDTIERVDDEKVVLMMKITSGSGVEDIRYKVMIFIDGEFIADVGEYTVYELVREVVVPVWVEGEKVTEMQKKFDEMIAKEQQRAVYNLEKEHYNEMVSFLKGRLPDYDEIKRIEKRLEWLEAEVKKWKEIRHRFSAGGVIWENELVGFFRNYIQIKVENFKISKETVEVIDCTKPRIAGMGFKIRIGGRFSVILPKEDDSGRVWILLRETPKLETVDIDRSAEEEVWTFRALRVGHSPLEFSWSMVNWGVWPSDERMIIEIEVR